MYDLGSEKDTIWLVVSASVYFFILVYFPLYEKKGNSFTGQYPAYILVATRYIEILKHLPANQKSVFLIINSFTSQLGSLSYWDTFFRPSIKFGYLHTYKVVAFLLPLLHLQVH